MVSAEHPRSVWLSKMRRNRRAVSGVWIGASLYVVEHVVESSTTYSRTDTGGKRSMEIWSV
jgi:hypothetical protein